jgi:hypothetical protein
VHIGEEKKKIPEPQLKPATINQHLHHSSPPNPPHPQSATMADKSRFYLEQSIPELQDLEKKKIFTKVPPSLPPQLHPHQHSL